MGSTESNWGGLGNPISGLRDLLGEGVPENPGGSVQGYRSIDTAYGPTGGKAPMTAVPGTNYLYDPSTGQYYLNQVYNGSVPGVPAPNLAQQGANSSVIQQLYLQQQQQALQQAAQTRAGQTALAGNYNDVIAGKAPSVAQVQLQTGMNQIVNDQNAEAAGANGQNAFAARRAAAQSIARAQGGLSGEQAMVRAGETNAARTGLSQLYGQEAQADAAADKLAADSALGYGKLGEQSEEDRQTQNERAAETNAAANKNVAGGIGAALMALF